MTDTTSMIVLKVHSAFHCRRFTMIDQDAEFDQEVISKMNNDVESVRCFTSLMNFCL